MKNPYRDEVENVSSCIGKDAFDTKALAEKVRTKMSRHGRGSKLGSFKCRMCHKWHVGTLTGKPDTKISNFKRNRGITQMRGGIVPIPQRSEEIP